LCEGDTFCYSGVDPRRWRNPAAVPTELIVASSELPQSRHNAADLGTVETL
jgi:hypothetical protein